MYFFVSFFNTPDGNNITNRNNYNNSRIGFNIISIQKTSTNIFFNEMDWSKVILLEKVGDIYENKTADNRTNNNCQYFLGSSLFRFLTFISS